MFDYLTCTLCYIHNGDASTQDLTEDVYCIQHGIPPRWKGLNCLHEVTLKQTLNE